MKDTKETNAASESTVPNEDPIVDLTPEMETGAGLRIVELTQPAESPSNRRAAAPLSPEPTADERAASDTPASTTIEADVDAAFDTMESAAAPFGQNTPVSGDPTLMLSRIAEPREIDMPSTTEPGLEITIDDLAPETNGFDAPEGPEGTDIEDTTQMRTDADDALDALEFGDTIDFEESPEEEEEQVLELTDIADPAETPSDDDDVLVLTDMVEPTEIPSDDDDVLMLTDIADPAEIPSDDDDVLVLTDIADPAEISSDDDVLVLTDMVAPQEAPAPGEPPETAAPAHPQDITTEIPGSFEQEPPADDPEEIIELSERVDPVDLEQEALSASGPNDDGIIELTDAVGYRTPEDDSAWNDNVIRLTTEASADESEDVVNALPDERIDDAGDGAFPSDPADAESAQADDDQVIRLDTVLDHFRERQSKIAQDISLRLEEELLSETGPAPGRDRPESRAAEPGMTVESEIEKAIERIVQKRYGDTIESLIAKVVENVVTRELESIKRSLMEGDEE